MGRYVSPIPAEERPNYRRRIEGVARLERTHLWGGGGIPCEPTMCRECYREKHWREGQTHGE